MINGNTSLDDRVGLAIGDNPYLTGRRVRFETKSDQVILEGTVSSYFQKQMAQETVLRIDGVRRIDNRLQVAAQRRA